MNVATHPVSPEEIMALLDAELPAERSQAVTAHLEACVSCGSVARTLRGGSEKLGGWRTSEMPAQPQFEAVLQEAARRVSSERPKSLVGAWRFAQRHWATAAVSAVCVVWLFSRSTNHFAAPPSAELGNVAESQTEASKSRTVREIGKSPAKHPLSLSQTASGDLARDDSKTTTFRLGDGLSEREKPASPSAVAGVPMPMMARTVSLSIVAKDFPSARAAMEAVLVRHHGYAASLTASTQQDSARSLVASLRIPAGELSAAIGELKTLGKVLNEQQGGEEVTQQHADLMARLKNSRETERRMQAILENRTGIISDVLQVEQEIARVRGEIEQMEAEQKALEHRVSFATVDLTLAEEYKAQIGQASPSISTRIHNAVVAGYREAVENLMGIVLFGAEHGPSLLIWAMLLAPIAWMFRRRWARAAAAM